MSKLPTIFLVGAAKGGVGKTTVRVLSDTLKARQACAKLFDTEYPAGDLSRFAAFLAAIIVPMQEIEMYLAMGWKLADEPHCSGAPMLPPKDAREQKMRISR